MTNIAGVFSNKEQANQSLANLLDAGFRKEDISLIISDRARHIIFPSPTDDEGERATRGGAVGALWGGALGVLLTGLTAVGAIVIPGTSLLAAGPVVAILTGAGTGAIAGGLSGALISAGFAVDEAKRYEKEVNMGRAVLVVHTTDEKAGVARRILDTMSTKVKAA